MMINRQTALCFFALLVPVKGFSSTLFREKVAHQKVAPAVQPGIDVELPDFDELFLRIKETSPLARVVLEGDSRNKKRGLASVENEQVEDNLPWKKVEESRKRLVHQIQKIDNFQGHKAPLLRFRANMEGPCIAHLFSNFLTTNEFRSMWDASLATVYEAYPIEELDTVNRAMGWGQYGDCTKIGVGYCTTKPSFGVDSREQLTMCGIQEFEDGSCIIWGTEMQSHHDHLLPEEFERRTRAKSHLFSTTLIPTGKDTYDVEYVIQLEIGGGLPNFLTTPVVIDNVKNMFKVVDTYFKDQSEGGALDKHLKDIHEETIVDDHSFLMTP